MSSMQLHDSSASGFGLPDDGTSPLQPYSPPALRNVSHTLDNHVAFSFAPDSDHSNIVFDFTSRYAPSQTSNSQCDWISVSCGPVQPAPSSDAIDAMRESFDILAASHRQAGNISLTVHTLDQLAQSHNVVAGKWMMFCKTAEVDEFWADVVRLICLHRGKGSAKVSPNKGDNQHVICAYVENFGDLEEVMGVRNSLRAIGVTYPVGFKMDAYTHLGIYRRNPWGINCNRYYE